MAEQTNIAWCDSTFNCWRGCSQVSPGCDHCYAETMSKRNPEVLGEWGPNGTHVVASEAQWKLPIKWNREAKKQGVPTIARLSQRDDDAGDLAKQWQFGSVMPNIWLGTTVENQDAADKRIPLLLKCPALVRFLSVEPLLEHVNLAKCAPYALNGDTVNPGYLNAFNGLCHHPHTCRFGPDSKGSNEGISWVICGGESGNNSRECHLKWLRDIVKQCKDADVPVFVKQMGSNPHDLTTKLGLAPGVASIKFNIRWELKDKKGGDIKEWPGDLQVREFPSTNLREPSTISSGDD